MFKKFISISKANKRLGYSVIEASSPKRVFSLSKRQKVVVTVVILSLGFLIVTQNTNIILRRHYLIFLLALASCLLSFWSLREGLTRTKAILLLILPTMFTLSAVGFYYTFREVRWLTRIPAAVTFGLLMYVILLAQNVFAVAAERTIPLYRAASTTSLVFTIFTALFSFSVISTLQLPFFWNFISVFVVCLPLVVQYLWSVEMEGVDRIIISYTVILSLITAEIAMALSFWPLHPVIWSLLLFVTLYINLGVTTEYFRHKLGLRSVLEYSLVGVLVLAISFLAARWNG